MDLVTLVLIVLVDFPAIAAAAAGIGALNRAGQRKGYRGPYLTGSLTITAGTVTAGAAIAVRPLHLPDSAFPITLVGLVALSMACCWLLVRLLPHRPTPSGIRSARFPFAVAAVVIPLGVIVLGVVMSAVGQPIGAPSLIGIGSLGTMCLSMSRRTRAPQVAQAGDLVIDGSPVLLLRAFRDERLPFSLPDTHRARRGPRRTLAAPLQEWLSAERYLGPAFATRIGPLVGLGNPVDYLPPNTGGMLRYYAPDEHWQAEVRRLVPQARAVLILASSSTRSLAWELSYLRETAAQPTTFLVLSRYPPPGERGAPHWMWFRWRLRGVQLSRWSQLVSEMAALGWYLPSTYPGPATVIGFDLYGHSRTLINDAETASTIAGAVADAITHPAHRPSRAPSSGGDRKAHTTTPAWSRRV